jgi:hypothetical protein
MTKIITEIHRIKEVMYGKQILVEGLVNILDDGIKYVMRVLDSAEQVGRSTDYKPKIGPTEINLGGTTDLNNFKSQVENLRNSLAQGKSLEDVFGTNIGKFFNILESDETLINNTFNSFFEQIRKSNPKINNEVKLIEDVYYGLDKAAGKSADSTDDIAEVILSKTAGARNGVVDAEDELVARMLASRFKTKMKDLDEIFIRSTKPGVENLAKTGGKIQIPSWMPDIISAKIQRGYVRFIKTQIENLKKTDEEIEKKIDDLLDIISYKIKNGEKYQNEIYALYDNIISLKKQKSQNIKQQFDDYLFNNKIIQYDKSVWQEVLTSSPQIQKVYNESIQDAERQVVDSFLKRVARNFGAGKPIYMADDAMRTIFDQFKGVVDESINNIVYGSTMYTREYEVLLARLGTKNLYGNIIKRWLVTETFFAAVWTLFDSIYRGFEVDAINRQIEQLKQNFCIDQDNPEYKKICDELISVSKVEMQKNIFETFISKLPIVSWFSDEYSDIIPVTRMDGVLRGIWNIFVTVSYVEGSTDPSTMWEKTKNYLMSDIMLPPEIRELGFDDKLSVEENFNKLKQSACSKIGENVKPWIESGDGKNKSWMCMKPTDYDDNKDDYKTIFVDNNTGELSKTKTNNTVTLYKKTTLMGDIRDFFDSGQQLVIKNNFDCLFENGWYDKTFGEDGFEWMGGMFDNHLGFRIKRTDGTIDEIRYVSLEDGNPIRLGDNVEFTCERAKELAGLTTTLNSGDLLTPEKAEELGIGNQFSEYNAEFYYINDEKVKLINKSDNRDWYIEKRSDGKWYYEGYDMLFESKKQNKKMKTLNESIREKLTSKYVNKTNKFLKINENYEKVYKHFEKGDYDTYFNKMFKLAEAFKSSKLYLTEADDELFSKGISLLGGQEEMIKEKFVDFLSKDLGLTPSMRDYIKPQIKNMSDTQIGDLFMKPSVVIDIIVDAVVENVKSSSSEPTDLMSAIELTTVPYFDSPEFRYKLSKVLKPMIGQKLENKKGKIIDMVKRALKAKEEKSES